MFERRTDVGLRDRDRDSIRDRDRDGGRDSDSGSDRFRISGRNRNRNRNRIRTGDSHRLCTWLALAVTVSGRVLGKGKGRWSALAADFALGGLGSFDEELGLPWRWPGERREQRCKHDKPDRNAKTLAPKRSKDTTHTDRLEA